MKTRNPIAKEVRKLRPKVIPNKKKNRKYMDEIDLLLEEFGIDLPDVESDCNHDDKYLLDGELYE